MELEEKIKANLKKLVDPKLFHFIQYEDLDEFLLKELIDEINIFLAPIFAKTSLGQFEWRDSCDSLILYARFVPRKATQTVYWNKYHTSFELTQWHDRSKELIIRNKGSRTVSLEHAHDLMSLTIHHHERARHITSERRGHKWFLAGMFEVNLHLDFGIFNTTDFILSESAELCGRLPDLAPLFDPEWKPELV